MNKQDIFTLISNIFGVEVEEIDLDSDFAEDLNGGSKDMLELKLQLEDLLQTAIDQEDFEEINTVDDLLKVLENYDALDEL